MVMGPANHLDKSVAVKRLATDGSNWRLLKATLKSYFKSRNLVKHVEGTAEDLLILLPLPRPMSSLRKKKLRLIRLRKHWRSICLGKAR